MRKRLELAGRTAEHLLLDFQQNMLNTQSERIIDEVILRQHKRLMVVLSIFTFGLFYTDLIIAPIQTVILTLMVMFLFVQRRHITIAWTEEHSDNKGGEV